MSIDHRLLEIIGRRLPSESAVALGRSLGSFRQNRLAEVALNPQPLPPLPEELGAAIAAEFIHAAWLADRHASGRGIAFDDLDDWCPTVPRKPKFPPWWPPIPEPEPHPEWFLSFHLGFAARVAVAASGLEGTPLGEALDKAIDRSLTSIRSVRASQGATSAEVPGAARL